jgi:hypothetical protein
VPALVLLLGGSCSRQSYPTPSRTLDRPSDAALLCVEYEVPPDSGCLPSPALSDAEYLAQYCGNTTSWRQYTPWTKVLAIGECEDGKLRQRRDAYYDRLRRAAQNLGRNPNAPCCPNPDDQICDEQRQAPVCLRRTVMTVIANTARGELALGDSSAQAPGLTTIGRLANLHGGAPGFGFLPVGLQPEHVRAHGTGTWAVTSNAGSCDLSVVALDKVVQLTARAANCDDAGQVCPTSDCDGESCPQRVEPWLPGGPTNKLRSRPAWVEIAPWAGSLSQSAIVSYPTCGVVAVVRLSGDAMSGEPRGKIVEAVAFDQQDPLKAPKLLTAAELQALRCPLDCGGEMGSQAPEPGMLPMGGLKKPAAYPVAVAVDGEGHRLLISDSVGSALTVIDFDPNAPEGSRLRGTPRRIPLDFDVRSEALRGGQRGIDVVRIGPRGAAGLYAYAVARDGTVRVIDLDREVECETNPDPRFVRQQGAGPLAPLRVLPDDFNDSNLRRLGCLPVDKTKTPRSPLQTGPGISLPNGSTPRDVGFVHADAPICTSLNPDECPFTTTNPDYFLRAQANLWVGDFAWILGGGGSVLGLQVADACPQPSLRACFPADAAQRRAALLHTRSQELPAPEQLNLPGLPIALMVSPLDRLGNVRRISSRFDETGDPGPRTESDATNGLPVFTARINGTQTAVLAVDNNTNRRRLALPAPAPYYYLPVDPVCDVALEAQVTNRASPDTGLLPEPLRRPVAMASFVDTTSVTSENWTLDWEGLVPGLRRATGRILSDGTLVDLNGLYCARGAEAGDKLFLPGCLSNSDCINGTTCRRESQSSALGLCLTNAQEQTCRDLSSRLVAAPKRNPMDPSEPLVPDSTAWAASWYRRYLITSSAQQVPATDGSHDVLDRLTLDELPEPEYALERESCDVMKVGTACNQRIAVRPPSAAGNAQRVLRTPSCHITGGTRAAPVTSCILECDTTADCGEGFLCGRSRYEEWEGLPSPRGRCMRAPLLMGKDPANPSARPGTRWIVNGRFEAMSQGDVQNLIAACFPDQSLYEVHAGDAFLVRGDRTGAPSVLRRRQDPMDRSKDGLCERPQPGDPTFQSSRLFQPRLRLGPRDSLPDTDPRRCPSPDAASWIPHRWAPAQEARQAPSCTALFNAGKLDILNVLPENQPAIRRAATYLPPTEMECRTSPTDPRCKDPWLRREYELFSSLLLDAPANQCVLTGTTDETFSMTGACGSDYCAFPGDHTEVLGVRRIHFENPYGNLVLRVPRDPEFPFLWAVPPDSYTVTFGVLGGQRPYVQLAQTSQRDGLTDVLAQGLRAAITAPSGVVYLVDEGRSGSTSQLRGRVIRMIGSTVDPYFILR